MDIHRRRLLKGTACLALAGLAGPAKTRRLTDLEGLPVPTSWHPLTSALLHRARRASIATGPVDKSGIERIIHDTVGALRWSDLPVIKWLADPFDAFAYLSRHDLDHLLQMDFARLWRRAGSAVDLDEDRLNSHLVLGGVVAEIVGAAEYDRVLMAQSCSRRLGRRLKAHRCRQFSRLELLRPRLDG